MYVLFLTEKDSIEEHFDTLGLANDSNQQYY